MRPFKLDLKINYKPCFLASSSKKPLAFLILTQWSTKLIQTWSACGISIASGVGFLGAAGISLIFGYFERSVDPSTFEVMKTSDLPANTSW